MKFTIDFGHPEVLLLCGTFLIVGNYFGFGLTLLILGVLGGVFRSGFRIQNLNQEAESKAKALKEMNDAGEELGSVLAGFFGALSGNKKKDEGTVH